MAASLPVEEPKEKTLEAGLPMDEDREQTTVKR